jgi:uncharacterized coiled-coil protein SlyX
VSDYIKSQRLSAEWFGLEIEPLRLQEIGARSKRHRKTAQEDYIQELAAVFYEVRRCLKPKHYCVLVIGESNQRTPVIPELVGQMKEIGYRRIAELERRISVQRRQFASIDSESILVFR